MSEQQPLQIPLDTKCFIIILNGGNGARIIESCFVRSLIRLRKQQNLHQAPILVIDSSSIGKMVAASFSKEQNIHNIQMNEYPNPFPHHTGFLPDPKTGKLEHPIFLDWWRNSFKQYNTGTNLYELINNNWDRFFSVDYSATLTKKIFLNKLKINDKKAFIAYHYASQIELEYDGDVPPLKVVEHDPQLVNFIDNIEKPYIVLHYGSDYNSQDMQTSINYRFHKVWSLQRWQELINNLSHKYQFISVHANQYNVQLDNVLNIKVSNFSNVLQLLQHDKAVMFINTDNYMQHLASSIKKCGITLWGSCSPAVWSWHNLGVPHFPIWNVHSCPIIGCWRPNVGDINSQGGTFVCDREYQCMSSITVKQVMEKIEEVEQYIINNKNKEKIIL